MKRVLVALAGGLLTVALCGPVSAQTSPYPPSGGGVSVSSTAVPPGGVITVTMTGFPPNTLVTFMFESTPVVVGTATSDSSGTATLTFTVPANAAPGVHTIVGSGGGVTKSVTITVVGGGVASPPNNGHFGTTGADVIRMIGFAFALLISGSVTIAIARWRRRV